MDTAYIRIWESDNVFLIKHTVFAVIVCTLPRFWSCERCLFQNVTCILW